jgi:hypothetical protein
MVIRPKADQCPQRGKQQRQCNHQSDDGGRNSKLDDHYPIQGARQQHGRHAARDLEQ